MKGEQAYSSDMPLDIKPRRMSFPFKRVEKRYFFADNPVLSAYIAALSSTFPAGEAEFIASVRLFRDQISDPKLQQQVRGFIGQEGHHSHQHKQLNQQFRDLGFDAVRLENHLARDIEKFKKRRPDRVRLALTAGMEHITAIMAEHALQNPETFDGLDEPIRELMLWHAVEEIEHKAVAFDVFMSVDGDRKLLHKTFKIATAMFSIRVSCYMVAMLWWSRTMPRWRHIKAYWQYLFGAKGVVTLIRKPYKDFFRADFHPWDHQNQALVDMWKQTFYNAEHDRASESFAASPAS